MTVANNNFVIVADTLTIQGVGVKGFPSNIVAATEGAGTGGNIDISTGTLTVTNGGAIETVNLGETGDRAAGNIQIDANSSVTVTGSLPPIETPMGLQERSSKISAQTQGNGDGGNITITAPRLAVVNNAAVETNTFLQAGDAGNLVILASGSIFASNSSISAQVDRGASGNGGNFTIKTPQFIAENNARISTATGSKGDSSNLNIETDNLIVRSGAQVATATQDKGNGGDLTVTASDTARISGVSPTVGAPSGLFTQTLGEGRAGNLNLRAENLIVEDGGKLSVSGTVPPPDMRSPDADLSKIGNAGNLIVNADELHLEQGILEATTISGDRGNIMLNSSDLRLRETSSIKTDAQGDSQGGNIETDTDTLVALENSDITADAVNNFGGRVVINTQGIYGTEFRNQQTPQSDITATSELGPKFSGIVEINTPEFDPTQGLVLPTVPPLPDVPANPCKIAGQETEFVNARRGGLPPTPRESINQEMAATTSAKIQEAQGWVRRDDGTVELVINPRHIIPYGYWLRLERPDCSTDSEENSDR
jgi:large exoprotein involved in heme utilization and adhesion